MASSHGSGWHSDQATTADCGHSLAGRIWRPSSVLQHSSTQSSHMWSATGASHSVAGTKPYVPSASLQQTLVGSSHRSHGTWAFGHCEAGTTMYPAAVSQQTSSSLHSSSGTMSAQSAAAVTPKVPSSNLQQTSALQRSSGTWAPGHCDAGTIM